MVGLFGFGFHAFVRREGEGHLCLGTYLPLKKKQQSKNTLTIAEASYPLNQLIKHRPIVAKRRFHLLSAGHD